MKLLTYLTYTLLFTTILSCGAPASKDKTVDTYIFKGERKKKEKLIKFDKKENPFNKLLSLNIK